MRPFAVRRPLIAGAVLVLALLSACGAPAAPPAANTADGCITDYVAGQDYFPDKIALDHAKNLTITYHDSYQVVTVPQPAPQAAPESYVLYRCGTPVPELTGELAGAQAVSVPIQSLFAGSTTHLPLLTELDALPVLTGLATTGYVSSPQVREMIRENKLIEFAPTETVNAEVVLAAQPDVLMTGGFGDPAYATIRQAGVAVVANAEWLEASPLGRAEWIKLVGALTGKEAKATEVFDRIETDYADVARAAAVSGPPTRVLLGQMDQGTWFMPGGDSYVATLIADANGTYDWSGERQTGSLSLSLEDVLAEARDADTWIMSADVQTLADVTAADPRYAEFAAFQQDRVWSNNARTTPDGGLDYWERGVARPDLVLADLVRIMHPEAVAEHELEFYRQLTPR